MAVDEIGSVLATVPDSGTAVMLVEQNVKLVETLCDQAWILSRGTVHGHGPVPGSASPTPTWARPTSMSKYTTADSLRVRMRGSSNDAA
ncbi:MULTISPECIES: hypothetical protein [Streptomyces]|uniref:hypothetical protein n=1 Tax=Streptomyces TaxID=1883 RepID=UPI003689653A